jgi:uncharacterized damage-inducible protein DinB
MTISEMLLCDFDIETASTQRVLERVPDDKVDWKPHDKSMSLKSLATHVATLPLFGNTILTTPLLDMAVTAFPKTEFVSTAQLVKVAEEAYSKLRATLASISDEDLKADWTLRYGDHVITTAPRYKLYRVSFFNHLIHHRGQLNVYLRLLDVKVPGIYGPSADEPFGG